MIKVKIIAHCLVKNEERFIWYTIKSVLPFVDKIIVWDTGSTDNTLQIIKSIKSNKIIFKEINSITAETFSITHQRMIKRTPKKYTWLLILDGDEIWPEYSIKKITQFARQHPNYESIVVRTNNLVGDIYHRLPESAGHYNLAGRTGHLSLRLINLKNIPGLHADKPHGQHGYFDGHNTLIQDRPSRNIKFLDIYYHHATHLQRSSTRAKDNQVIKRAFKYKYETGNSIPNKQIPKIFFQSHPSIVPDVTAPASTSFRIISFLVTPLRRIKRSLLPSASGY